MNRLEVIAVFKAIEILAEEDNTKGIKEIASTVLREAMSKTEKDIDDGFGGGKK